MYTLAPPLPLQRRSSELREAVSRAAVLSTAPKLTAPMLSAFPQGTELYLLRFHFTLKCLKSYGYMFTHFKRTGNLSLGNI